MYVAACSLVLLQSETRSETIQEGRALAPDEISLLGHPLCLIIGHLLTSATSATSLLMVDLRECMERLSSQYPPMNPFPLTTTTTN